MENINSSVITLKDHGDIKKAAREARAALSLCEVSGVIIQRNTLETEFDGLSLHEYFLKRAANGHTGNTEFISLEQPQSLSPHRPLLEKPSLRDFIHLVNAFPEQGITDIELSASTGTMLAPHLDLINHKYTENSQDWGSLTFTCALTQRGTAYFENAELEAADMPMHYDDTLCQWVAHDRSTSANIKLDFKHAQAGDIMIMKAADWPRHHRPLLHSTTPCSRQNSHNRILMLAFGTF